MAYVSVKHVIILVISIRRQKSYLILCHMFPKVVSDLVQSHTIFCEAYCLMSPKVKSDFVQHVA